MPTAHTYRGPHPTIMGPVKREWSLTRDGVEVAYVTMAQVKWSGLDVYRVSPCTALGLTLVGREPRFFRYVNDLACMCRLHGLVMGPKQRPKQRSVVSRFEPVDGGYVTVG